MFYSLLPAMTVLLLCINLALDCIIVTFPAKLYSGHSNQAGLILVRSIRQLGVVLCFAIRDAVP